MVVHSLPFPVEVSPKLPPKAAGGVIDVLRPGASPLPWDPTCTSGLRHATPMASDAYGQTSASMWQEHASSCCKHMQAIWLRVLYKTKANCVQTFFMHWFTHVHSFRPGVENNLFLGCSVSKCGAWIGSNTALPQRTYPYHNTSYNTSRNPLDRKLQ